MPRVPIEQWNHPPGNGFLRSVPRQLHDHVQYSKMLGSAFNILSFSFSELLVPASRSLDPACPGTDQLERHQPSTGPLHLLTRQKREKGLSSLGALKVIFGHKSKVKRTKGLAYAFGAIAVLLSVSTSRRFTITVIKILKSSNFSFSYISWHIHVLHPHWPFHIALICLFRVPYLILSPGRLLSTAVSMVIVIDGPE